MKLNKEIEEKSLIIIEREKEISKKNNDLITKENELNNKIKELNFEKEDNENNKKRILELSNVKGDIQQTIDYLNKKNDDQIILIQN